MTEKGREGQQEKGRAVYHVCDRERKGGAVGEREGSVSCVCDREREGQQEKGRAVYHVCDRERKGGAAGEREGSVSCV